MASIFGHAVVAVGGATLLPKEVRSTSLVGLGIASACMPDIDVVGFYMGIPYDHLFGHRGITHSISFGILWSIFITLLYVGLLLKPWSWSIFCYLAFCTVSHGLIDACTNGGHGIALLAPVDNNRLFFDFRPILVSPLGVKRFFGKWGIKVLLSEALWLGVPSLILAGSGLVWRRIRSFTKG